MAPGKKRLANIELLRILAMLMVTMLHYLDKGGVLPDLTGSLGPNGYAAWVLELLSIVAVDIYMLISGFFLVESGFKTKRLVQLICQVLFYSLLIPLALMACGILDPSQLTLYQILYYVFPVQMVHYWFITAYVTMYLFSPILRIAVKGMKKEQLRLVIILLLLFLSVSKSVIPVQLTMDNLGYDGLWFICVYLVAAYLRLYGMEELKEKKLAQKGFLLYFILSAAMFCLTFFIRFLYMKTGKFGYFITTVCGYNHILTLLAAVCLFVGFYNWKIREGVLSRIILRIAPYSLGVYLLQEHWEIRTLWPSWLGASAGGSAAVFCARCLGSVILAFGIGICVDMLRGALFALIGRLALCRRINDFFCRIDELLSDQKGK